MSGVFLDTVGLIAVWDRHDQWHAAAVEAWSRIIAEGTPLFATSYIIAECANAASRRPYRSTVERPRATLAADARLVFPNSGVWDTACAAYAIGQPGAPGLVDELSFVTMRRLGLNRAFTNDAHFRTAGFETLF